MTRLELQMLRRAQEAGAVKNKKVYSQPRRGKVGGMNTQPSPDWEPVFGLRELAAISCLQVLMQRDNHPLREPQGPEELAQEAMVYSDALVRKIVKWQKMRLEGILNR